MIGRRHFITLLGGAAAWPLAARAQEDGRTYRLGFLLPAARQTPPMEAFFDEVRLNGFVEGKNLVVVPGFEATDNNLAELVLVAALLLFHPGVHRGVPVPAHPGAVRSPSNDRLVHQAGMVLGDGVLDSPCGACQADRARISSEQP
jgi:hypothetical protein